MQVKSKRLGQWLLLCCGIALQTACDVNTGQGSNPADTANIGATDTSVIKQNWPFLTEENRSPGSLAEEALMRRNIYIVFDGSGSMSELACNDSNKKILLAKQAINEFVKSVPEGTNLGLFAFDLHGRSERVALANDNRPQLENAVHEFIAGGDTPLASAINTAFHKLTEQARRQLGYGEYHLVIVTDGEASSGQDPRSLVDQIISTSPVIIHTFGFCIGTHHSLNQPGRVIYQTANSRQELNNGLQSVLAEAPDFQAVSFK